MNSSSEHPQPDFDASTAEAVLGSAQPSGDPDLDAALDALRALVSTVPEPTGELTRLLGPAVPATAGDELGRRRQTGARHVATGTTVVAGIVLATATAAAAIGGLRADSHPATPTFPPTVVAHRESPTPRPVETTPERLPVLPAVGSDPTHTNPAGTGHHDGPGRSGHGTAPSSSRHGDDADDSRGSDDSSEAPDGDHEGQSRPSTGHSSTAPTDGDGDSSGPSSGDGSGGGGGGGDTSGDSGGHGTSGGSATGGGPDSD